MALTRQMTTSLLHHAIVRRQWPPLILGVLALALGAALLGVLDVGQVRTLWSGSVEPFINLATFLVAMLVWFADAYRGWRESLPCRLTAVFVCDGRELMRCERAALAAPADIRAMGQQLGQSMNNNQRLNLMVPTFEVSGGAPEEGADGSVYCHYRVRFGLLERPASLPALGPDQMLVWRAPFERGPEVLGVAGTGATDAGSSPTPGE
jgi:hypothetical protein